MRGPGCDQPRIADQLDRDDIVDVYWPGSGQGLDVLLHAGEAILETAPFEAARRLPNPCRGCTFEAPCHGGCAGRRHLLNRLDQPDPYCPVVRGDMRRLAIRMAADRDLPKLESACTTIC